MNKKATDKKVNFITVDKLTNPNVFDQHRDTYKKLKKTSERLGQTAHRRQNASPEFHASGFYSLVLMR